MRKDAEQNLHGDPQEAKSVGPRDITTENDPLQRFTAFYQGLKEVPTTATGDRLYTSRQVRIGAPLVMGVAAALGAADRFFPGLLTPQTVEATGITPRLKLNPEISSVNGFVSRFEVIDRKFGPEASQIALGKMTFRQAVDAWNGAEVPEEMLGAEAVLPVESYTIPRSELPSNAIELSPGVWTAEVPKKLSDAFQTKMQSDIKEGVNPNLTMGTRKGRQDIYQGLWIQADGSDRMLPVIVGERCADNGIIVPTKDGDQFYSASMLIARDIVRKKVTVSADGTLVHDLARYLGDLENVPFIAENYENSPAPTILALREWLTLEGAENFEFGQPGQPDLTGTTVNQYLEKTPDKKARVTQIDPATLPEPLRKELVLDKLFHGHFVPTRLITWLDEKFPGARAIPHVGYPIGPAWVTKGRVGNDIKTFGVQLFERAIAVCDENGNWSLSLPGNTLTSAVNNGKEQLPLVVGGTAPEPSSSPSPEPVTPGDFPKEIGNLATDHVAIHNKGAKIGVLDNRQDPQNNFQALAAAAKQFAPNDKFQYIYYDNPNDVPDLPAGTKPTYDPIVNWGGSYLGATPGKQARIFSNGVWQWHLSLPKVSPADINRLNRDITSNCFTFLIRKDNTSATWGEDFGKVLGQQVFDPEQSGKNNYAFRVIEK